MTVGKAAALTAGFLGAFAVGIAVGPSVETECRLRGRGLRFPLLRLRRRILRHRPQRLRHPPGPRGPGRRQRQGNRHRRLR